ncbi:hypothetical protein EV360DRAFT_77314, partial [Lentinula raphanica]
MSRPRPQISTITTTTAVGREEELRIFLQPTNETPTERRRREAEEEEAALQELQRRREENQRRRDEEEAEEKRKEEEEAARRAEEERAQREAEEAAEAERCRKVKEGKKRKAEEEKAGKAKKTKVADSGQGPSSEQLRAARLRRFSRTSNASTRASPAETIGEAGPSRKRMSELGEILVMTNIREETTMTMTIPMMTPSRVETRRRESRRHARDAVGSKESRPVYLKKERTPRPANHVTTTSNSALKEGFVDMAQGQHEILELVRESAGTTDQRLQALER